MLYKLSALELVLQMMRVNDNMQCLLVAMCINAQVMLGIHSTGRICF